MRFLLLAASLPLLAFVDLKPFEASLYSKDGEDGVLSKIFQLVAPNTKYCVELGAGDGITDSSTYLLRLQGWKSDLFDRSYEIAPFNLHKEFLTAENINFLFEQYAIPDRFDLLVFDVHYNDYHFWRALDSKYRPQVVSIKYNPFIENDVEWVVKYRPFYCGDGSNYFGANLVALENLGKSKGYTLIYKAAAGSTLFFIANEALP